MLMFKVMVQLHTGILILAAVFQIVFLRAILLMAAPLFMENLLPAMFPIVFLGETPLMSIGLVALSSLIMGAIIMYMIVSLRTMSLAMQVALSF